MGRLPKRLSKRKTLKLKHKIEKKVRDSRKQAKKKEATGRTKSKKDPGIPNSYPFKEQELANIELQRQQFKAEKEKAKELRKKASEKKKRLAQQQQSTALKGGSVSATDLLSAAERASQHSNAVENDGQDDASAVVADNQQTRQRQKGHIKELKKMFEMADVLLEVLDARDPLGCRCTTLETQVVANRKKIILVLNKIDLVPKEAVQKWLTYLRQSHPAIAFKANTHKGKVGRTDTSVSVASTDLLNSSDCLGADTLVQLLKNYSRSHDMKKTILVGVMGYPNVGKSSLINSLKRSKAVGVSPCPGFTRKVTEIHLDSNIKLLDCPGVVFDAPTDNSFSPDVILRNAVAVEKVVDPVAVVNAIIHRCGVTDLARAYNIATFKTATEFLLQVAKLRGKLKRGGLVDLEAAARTVLMDWNVGKIPYYTLPPIQPVTPEVESESVIVSQWAKEFDVEALLRDEETDLNRLTATAAAFIQMQPGQAGSADLNDDDDMNDE